jgi:AcrR family transcriptional regulator
MQIIKAVIETVAELGYAGASLSKLAGRAKISKSIISYHFTGKNELLEETVHHIYAHIVDSYRQRIFAAESAGDQLRAYLESEFAYLANHRSELLTVANILNNHRDRRGRLYLKEEAETTSVEVLGKILEAGQQSGAFRPFPIRPMAVTIHCAINGALEEWVIDPTMSLAAYAEELVTIFELATRKNARPSTAARAGAAKKKR